MKLRNCLIVIIIALTSCAKANFKEGITSFQVQDYRRAFIRLLPEAQRGNPDAQYAVGFMYFYGQGVTEDRKKALQWIKLAAAAGQPDALAAMNILTAPPKNNTPLRAK